MTMTTWKMSEQKRNIVMVAVSKFFSAFSQRGMTRNYNVIGLMASFLYLMKKGRIFEVTNVSEFNNSRIITIMGLSYMEVTSEKVFEEWIKKGIVNIALITDISSEDPMASTISDYLSLLDKVGCEPAYIFEFFESISEIQEGKDFYIQVLDIAVSIFTSTQYAGFFSQPKECAELASALVNTNGKTIFNPFSGLMSFATSMNEYTSFTGVEKDTIIADISMLRMYLADIQDKVKCFKGDVCDWVKGNYDVLISTPPLGITIDIKNDNRSVRAEWYCLERFEYATNDNGILFTFVIPSLLFNRTSESCIIRQMITEKNYLDTVITLPANLLRPYTSVSLVAILLKKNRTKDAPIKMINASEFNKGDNKKPILDVEGIIKCFNNPDSPNCIRVTQDDIRQNNYIWSVEKYLNKGRETFPEGYKVVYLEEVLELVRGESHFDEKIGHFVQIANLASEAEDCIRTVNSFETSKDLSHATKITEPVILLSSIRVLKPTYCEASKENPVFLHPHVRACRIKKSWVSPTYLCLELSRRFVHSEGNVIPHINLSDLLEMRLAFPSIETERSFEEQNNLYKEAANNARLAKAKELGLQSIIESMKSEYINTVRTRKHDMMPYMRELGSVARSIRGYIAKYGSSELQAKMTNLLVQFDDAFNGLSALVEVFSQENKFGTPESVNIDSYLRKLAKKYEERQTVFSVEYYCDDNALKAYGLPAHTRKKGKSSTPKSGESVQLFVEIASLDLDRVVSNIIDNAVLHGFIDAENKDYHINISLTVVPERDMFQVEFSNNGHPLPVGVDKKNYGMLGEKAGITGKTGQGGHIVKSIVEHYNGDYDIFMEGENTVVRILLPISKKNEYDV